MDRSCSGVSVWLVLTLVMLVPANSQDTMGPVCYHCPSTENPEFCRWSIMCRSDQACSVQERIEPHGQISFWSGCEDIAVCGKLSETMTSPGIIGRRQASISRDRCVYCCSDDLCNRNCSSFVNLALHQPAYQSSTSNRGPASLANDGNTDMNYFHGSCMHTDNEIAPWWAVDLGHEFTITRVKIYERNDAGADGRVFHLKILVSSSNATLLDYNSNEFTQCGYYFGHSSDGDVIRVNCPEGTKGRWVRVQDSDQYGEYLHFCEVEVFGY